MNKKCCNLQGFFIFILTLFLISTNYVLIVTSNDSVQANSLADLQLETFEVWWSEVDNGTIFIRYIVNNTGSTFRHEFKPIRLNISFKLNSSSNEFAFVNQPSFIDPYAWYTGEKLSGCIHTSLHEKPAEIYAEINADKSIPEFNYSNNLQNSSVYYGVHLSGYVFKRFNDSIIPANNVSLKRCDSESLAPSLSIRFDTNESGFFNVVLYPKHPLTELFCYDMLVTDKDTSQVMHLKTSRISTDKTHFFNITFHGKPPEKPNNIRGLGAGIQKVPNFFVYNTINGNVSDQYYKIKWDESSYGDWIGPFSLEKLVFLIHIWDQPGLKSIKIISKSDTGLLSEWSDSKLVYIL